MPSHLWLAKGGIVTNSGLRRRPGPRNHASRGNKEPSRVLAWLKGLQGGGSRSDGGNRKIPAPTQGFGIKYSTPLAAGRSGGAAHPCPVNDLADSGAVTGPAEPSGNPIRCPTVEHLAQEKRTSMAWFIWGVGGSRLCTGQNRHRFSAPVNWRSPRPAVGIAFAHQAIAATVLARWRSRRVPRIAAAR